MPPVQRVGTVTGVAGLVMESDGPNVGLGEMCLVRSTRTDFTVRAEVVGFREHRLLLMPLGDTAGLHVGCEVAAGERPLLPRPGPELLGRVLDALGRPFDGLGALALDRSEHSTQPPHPLRRQRIREALPTGVRALDTFVPLGHAPTLAPGFPSRADAQERYAARSGRDLAALDFYVAFGYWKLACILEGVFSRYAGGAGGGDQSGVDAFAGQIDALAAAAGETAGRLR